MVDPQIETKFDDAQFDSDTWDYSNTDSQFFTDVLADFQNIIKEVGSWYHLIQITETCDSLGNITSVSEQHINIQAYMEDLSRNNRNEHTSGVSTSGLKRIFVNVQRIDNGVTYIPKVGDIFEDVPTDTTIDCESTFARWRLEEQIGKRKIGNKPIFMVFIGRLMDNSILE